MSLHRTRVGVALLSLFALSREGRNGEGNAWYTEGDLYEGVIKKEDNP